MGRVSVCHEPLECFLSAAVAWASVYPPPPLCAGCPLKALTPASAKPITVTENPPLFIVCHWPWLGKLGARGPSFCPGLPMFNRYVNTRERAVFLCRATIYEVESNTTQLSGAGASPPGGRGALPG